jgi:hypothetical protein
MLVNSYAVDALPRSGIWLVTAGEIDVEDLTRLLAPGEEPIVVARGYVVRSARPTFRKWLIVATTDRLLCIKGRIDRKSTMLEIPRGAIRDVSVGKAIAMTELTVTTGQGDVHMQLPRDSAAAMRRALLPGDGGRMPLPALPAEMRATAQIHQHADGTRTAYLEIAVERLETEVARLQQQVDFLEELMRKK